MTATAVRPRVEVAVIYWSCGVIELARTVDGRARQGCRFGPGDRAMALEMIESLRSLKAVVTEEER